MPPEPPQGGSAWTPQSKLLATHGLAVLRDRSDRYVSLECGGTPGGHGHPDLLHLSLFAGGHVLADFGTGSYVTPSLHWYRSALAHNAPSCTGLGQLSRDGWCNAFEIGEQWSWCRARARDLLGEGTEVERAVVLGQDYVLDVVDVQVAPGIEVDLPLHPVAGFEELDEVSELQQPLGVLTCGGGVGEGCDLLLAPRPRETVFTAVGPGPADMRFADGAPLRYLVRRATGAGRWAQCYALRPGTVRQLAAEGDAVTVARPDGSIDRFEFAPGGVRIREASGAVHSLAGSGEKPPPPARGEVRRPVIRCPLLGGVPEPANWPKALPPEAVARLTEAHYRRSELPYGAAGTFAAQVAVFAVDSRVCFAADVTKQTLALRDAAAPALGLDNEADDIHADGVQLYLGDVEWEGYVALPDPHSERMSIRAVAGTSADAARCEGRWARTDTGYTLVVTVDVGRPLHRGDRMLVGMVVNEMYPERERRAGQLALAGGGGWVYLRGDRESPATAVTAEVS
jgi:hypothetical protein